MLYVDTNACMKCGKCLFNAPSNAIILKGEFPEIVNDKCESEYSCINACPFGAIKEYF